MLIKRLQGQLEKLNGYYYEFDMHSKPLGEGGMGVVYKGFKIYKATGNRSVVAIKAMFDGLPSEVYERAEREASIRLRNDNLVEMLGFISEIEIDPYGMQKKRYYVVSEYLNGVVLSDLLAGQNYYVRVCAYKKIGKTTYQGEYSKPRFCIVREK